MFGGLNKYKQRVFSYILQMVKDQDLANDLFQEVFIKVITNLKKNHYNHEGKLLSWILRISHNQVIELINQNKMTIEARNLFACCNIDKIH